MRAFLARHRALRLTPLLVLLGLLTGCKYGANMPAGNAPTPTGADFTDGMFNGFMTLIFDVGRALGITTKSVYNDHNNGAGYSIGHFIGIVSFVLLLYLVILGWRRFRS